jgi:hypothetical protein
VHAGRCADGCKPAVTRSRPAGLEQLDDQAPHTLLRLPCPRTGTCVVAGGHVGALVGGAGFTASCTRHTGPAHARCPLAGQPQTYLLTPGGLLELNRYKHKHSSWFVGQHVQSGAWSACGMRLGAVATAAVPSVPPTVPSRDVNACIAGPDPGSSNPWPLEAAAHGMHADGGLLLASPVDVLLLLLPLLEAGPGGAQVAGWRNACGAMHALSGALRTSINAPFGDAAYLQRMGTRVTTTPAAGVLGPCSWQACRQCMACHDAAVCSAATGC